jgi:DnaJ-class molecular chaperone
MKTESCPTCRGRGKIPDHDNEWTNVYNVCDTCNGTGKIIKCPGNPDHILPSDNIFKFCPHCGTSLKNTGRKSNGR